MNNLFGNIYSGKKVLITGHTGFKGSWLAFWLSKMGTEVIGYSLQPPTKPNHFELLAPKMVSIIGDVRDQNKLADVFKIHQPEMVFHLAAQPLVRLSYKEPVETYEVNIMGTIKVLEACRKCDSVKAIVVVTSDKAYQNNEWIWGYRENDPMGGFDPYSSSKGCAELVVSSYRNSFFNPFEYGKKHKVLLASCRAGNVIGGGDWAKDRLISDIMTSVSRGEKVSIRNPYATRPWQHVLEPLSGYLQVGQKLLEGKREFAEPWNFGPGDEGSITVKEVVESVKKYWNKIDYEINSDVERLHEANLLKLDCSKAHIKLGWKAIWDSESTFQKTVEWYKAFYEDDVILSENDLMSYIENARVKQMSWIK